LKPEIRALPLACDAPRIIPMDASIRTVLYELEALGQGHDAREPERTRKFLNLDPETAHLVSLLIRSSRRTRILEIGTSNGYSTIWLAWATRGLGGRVVSIDHSPEKHAQADANLRRAGLRSLVELRTGEATQEVAGLPGPFDCVFFDADRVSAPGQLALLMPKLTLDALVLADNASSHPEEIAGYLAALRALPEFDHIVVPIGKGLSVAYRGN
jgi:predicted O-methyltransferase YrrM